MPVLVRRFARSSVGGRYEITFTDSKEPLPVEAIPSTGFLKWVTTILSMTQVSQNVILLALMFIHRLKKYNPGVKGKLGSEYRLLTVALMLGNKCELLQTANESM